MKIYGADNSELMEISVIERDGNTLLIKGKIYGTMPLSAKLHPQEARKVFRLLDFRTILFILTMPFRSASSSGTE